MYLSSDAMEFNIFLLKKHQEMWLNVFVLSWKTSAFGINLYQSLETPWTSDSVENLSKMQQLHWVDSPNWQMYYLFFSSAESENICILNFLLKKSVATSFPHLEQKVGRCSFMCPSYGSKMQFTTLWMLHTNISVCLIITT